MEKKLGMKLVVASSLVVLISGCVVTEARVLTATPNTVSYQYDGATRYGLENAVKNAKAHCAKYGKSAELENTTGNTFGFSTAVFECKK